MDIFAQMNELDRMGRYEEVDEMLKKLSDSMKDDPCWDGYEMVGTKKKNGKDVPNCVPKKKA